MRRTHNMARAGLMAGLTALCAWIAIPLPPISVTMQTFAVCLCLGVLGGKWGSVSLVIYVLLGAVGVPVFTGFRGGLGVILGPTGGFLWGFLLAGPAYWAVERLGRLPAMVAAMAVCYLCGCLWYRVYAPGTTPGTAFLICVAPYLIPDAAKIALALHLTKKLHPHLR